MYKFKYGFSMVELMLLLLIASLILAATVPVITKKHLHLPFSTNHGSYICYYDQKGELYEDRKSGKITQKSLAGYPRKVNQCVFEPPAKAVMFQVTAIGGGGGGGDAGYEYIEPDTVTESAKEIQPFNITEKDLVDIGVASTDPNTLKTDAKNEVIGYMGQLWGFAQGPDSGDAGYIYYTNVTEEENPDVCPEGEIKYDKVTKTKNVSTTIDLCQSSTAKSIDDPHTVTGAIFDCKDEDGNIVGGYLTFKKDAGGNYNISGTLPSAECSGKFTTSSTCKYYNNDDPSQGLASSPTYSYSCTKTVTKTTNHPAVYYEDGRQYIKGKKQGKEIPCTNPCQYLGQTNCNKGPCYGEQENVYGTCESGNHITQCLKTAAWTEYSTTDVSATCTGNRKCFREGGTETTKTWTNSAPADVTYGQISGNGVVCSPRTSGNNSFNGKLTYYEYKEAGCNVASGAKYGKYTKIKYPSSLTDYYKGYNGKFCTTEKISGGLGYIYATDITYDINNTKAGTGPTVNNGLITVPNRSFCGTGNNDTYIGECGPSEGSLFANEYAQTLINNSITGTNYFIRSLASTQAAYGDRLQQVSKIIQEFDGFDEGGNIKLKDVTYYYDQPVSSSGGRGTEGVCYTNEAQTSSTTTTQPDCRGSSKSRVGYCLKHHYDNDSNAVLNGSYTYFDKYQTGTLKRGLPGQSGEYKTIILRSMKDIDTTITVGRGGTGATIKSGDDGAHGDSTSFGTLLLAKGGDGGAGNQLINERLRLQKYDGNATGADFDMVRRCFNDQLQEGDNQATCNQWKADPNSLPYYKNTAGDSGEPPVRKSAGGIFNFILAALGLNNNETVMDIMEFSGRGGQGGGVQHFCWAGQYILNFERRELYKSSIYFEDKLPSGHEDDVPANHRIPIGCKTAYDHVQAGDGYDGALIITW